MANIIAKGTNIKTYPQAGNEESVVSSFLCFPDLHENEQEVEPVGHIGSLEQLPK